MIKTDNDPNIDDLWHADAEDSSKAYKRIYNDDESIVSVDGNLYEGFKAFVAEVVQYPKNVLGYDVDEVTGVRLDGTMIEVFYKDDGEETSVHFDYKHVNVVTVTNL